MAAEARARAQELSRGYELTLCELTLSGWARISPKRAELAGLNGVSPQCGTGSIFSAGGHHFERDEESRALVTLL